MFSTLGKYFECFLRGRETVRHLQELEKSQWLSPSEIKSIQLRKLKNLLRHAYDNVPFYREKFKEAHLKPTDIGTFENLQKLPITTKNEMKAYAPAKIVAHNYNLVNLVRGQTGGTTGKPFVYFKDKRTIDHEFAALSWFRSWYGSFGLKQTLFRLSIYPLPWSREFKSFLSGWLICDRNLDTISKYTSWIRGFKPRVLEGSPVAFYVLANFLTKKKLQKIEIPILLSTSETLFNSHRQKIESEFSCHVFNHYGSNEIGSIAQECEEHKGLHVNALDRIVEFVKGGENVSVGEMGEMVITDLENYAMPFIRYNIKDVGVPTNGSCLCGRGLSLIKEIHGRASDLLVSSDGNLVTSEILAQFILCKGHAWMEQFQVIQPSTDEIMIRVAQTREHGRQDLELISSEIRSYLGAVSLRTEFIDEITPPASGKHRFIISEASTEFFSQHKESSLL